MEIHQSWHSCSKKNSSGPSKYIDLVKRILPVGPFWAIQSSGWVALNPSRLDCDWWRSKTSWCAAGDAWNSCAFASCAKWTPVRCRRGNPSPYTRDSDLATEESYCSTVKKFGSFFDFLKTIKKLFLRLFFCFFISPHLNSS